MEHESIEVKVRQSLPCEAPIEQGPGAVAATADLRLQSGHEAKPREECMCTHTHNENAGDPCEHILVQEYLVFVK